MPMIQTRAKLWLALCVGVLLVSMTSSTAQAAYVVPRMLTNDITSFATGSFQRTQLSSYKRTGTTFQDASGAAQLMPLGIVKFKNRVLTKLLPYQLIRMGTAVIGNRIYVIGGVAKGGQKPNNGGAYNSESTDLVYSMQIDLATGDMIGDAWRAETTLPAVVSSDQAQLGGDPNAPIPASVVNSPAVASVQTGGQNFIYVIGGNTRLPGGSLRDFSSNAVRVGTVAGDGTITWKALPGAKIPAAVDEQGLPPQPKYGVQGASAVTMTVNGSTYVYLIGGLQRYLVGSSIVEAGSRAVFYAKVSGDGTLRKKDGTEGWDRMSSQLPVDSTNANAGLWDAAAVAGQYNTNEVGGIDKVIHVFGGQKVSARFEGGGGTNEYNAKVIQLYVINDDQGWPVPTLGDAEDDTLPEPRVGLGAVTFRGKHYVGGGATGTNPVPTTDMLTTYVEDDMSLPNFGGPGGANFIVDRTSFNEGRAFHGMAIVPAGESAYVYIIGGQTSAFASTTPIYSDQVIFGKIGGNDESEAVGLSPDGWYYSQPVEFLFNNAEVQEINWSTFMTDTTGMDIDMSYRVSSNANCNSVSWTVNDWVAIDGSPTTAFNSKNGENTISLQGVKARCFQYRARLKGGSLGDLGLAKETPSLLYVSLKILIPGSPDLRADGPGDVQAVTTPEGNLEALIVQIRNKNSSQTDPTLDANVEGKGGSFFVDLIIYKEGDPITVPTIPVSGSGANQFCTSIDKSTMSAGAVNRINQWYAASNETDCRTSPGISVLDYLKQRGGGKYTVFVVVDSNCGDVPYGCVDERDAPGGEANNITRYDFTYSGKIIYRQSTPLIQVKR